MMLLWEPDKLIGIRHGGPSSWREFRGLLARANYGAVAISRRKSRTWISEQTGCTKAARNPRLNRPWILKYESKRPKRFRTSLMLFGAEMWAAKELIPGWVDAMDAGAGSLVSDLAGSHLTTKAIAFSRALTRAQQALKTSARIAREAARIAREMENFVQAQRDINAAFNIDNWAGRFWAAEEAKKKWGGKNAFNFDGLQGGKLLFTLRYSYLVWMALFVFIKLDDDILRKEHQWPGPKLYWAFHSMLVWKKKNIYLLISCQSHGHPSRVWFLIFKAVSKLCCPNSSQQSPNKKTLNYIYLGKMYNDLSRGHPKIWFRIRESPQKCPKHSSLGMVLGSIVNPTTGSMYGIFIYNENQPFM